MKKKVMVVFLLLVVFTALGVKIATSDLLKENEAAKVVGEYKTSGICSRIR